jgi:hypothetical protein
MLSLGLAVIFGLLNIINFTHGAQYMMGAFVAYLTLTHLGLGYWWSLLLAPIAVGAFGILLERTMLHRLYKLDHLYGLLLTFGIALIVEGFFRNQYGSSGLPYAIPIRTARRLQPRLHVPADLPRLGRAGLAHRLLRHLVRDRAHPARRLPARRDREPDAGPGLRHQRAADDHPDLRLRRGAGRLRRGHGGADLFRSAR